MVLGIDFLKDVDSFWVANRSQVGSKNRSSRGLGGVLVGLGGLLGAKTEQGHEVSVFWGETSVFWGALRAVLGSSWGRLGGLLGRLAVQDGTRIGKKSIPKSIEIWMPLGIGILSDLRKFLVPKMGASWHQNRS